MRLPAGTSAKSASMDGDTDAGEHGLRGRRRCGEDSAWRSVLGSKRETGRTPKGATRSPVTR